MTDSDTSSPAGALMPGMMLHEYRIDSVLGHGGFGITYLARDTHLDKIVAIKEYLPADLAVRSEGNTVAPRSSDSREAFGWGLESFVKEARMLARFSHPNLIQVHRFFEDNGTAYFVMEYAEGTTLAAELRQSGTLPESRIRNVLLPVMSGLEQVHREGVLHRDIKPDNIILRSDGSPVLIDFGAARQNLGSMTRSVMSVLTAGYAPLEQYATSGNQGPWTDLYALGAVAYRALSGRKPVEAVTRVRDDPMVPATLAGSGRYSPHFLAAVDWALTIAVEDRPSSIVEWRLALEGKKAPPTAVRPPVAAPAPQPEAPTLEPTLVMPRAGVAEVPVAPTRVMGGEPTELLTSAPPPTAARARIALWVVSAVSVLLAFLLVWLVVRDRPDTKPLETVSAPAVQDSGVPPPAPAPAETGTEEQPPKMDAENATQSEVSRPAPVVQPKPEPKPRPPPREKEPARPAPVTPIAAMAPLSSFRDCETCPEMVVLPKGSYLMGAPKGTAASWESPQHRVTLSVPVAIGRHEVTRAQWDACVAAGACVALATTPAGGAARMPVVNMDFEEARAYAQWLSQVSRRSYRLPTEAEWEYATRAGTTTTRYWGDDRSGQCEYANGADQSALRRNAKLQAVDCDDGHAALAPVGTFKANAFGLFDVAGNAWEWTLDCWKDSYAGVPSNGSAVDLPGCSRRVIRGGSWLTKAESLRSSNRGVSYPNHRGEDLGLRVVAE